MTALATPGADGQIQTLLQVMAAMRYRGDPVARALAAPRWRSERGAVLVEVDHPARRDLVELGHDLVPRPVGDEVFGAVVAAGHRALSPPVGPSTRPEAGILTWASADWRRMTWSGVA